MESKYIKFFCAACIACAMTACSDDDNGDVLVPSENGENGGKTTTEQSVMTLTISQANPNTYAYNGTDPATAAETAISSDVDIYIFDDAGYFEDHKLLNVTNTSGNSYVTDTFKVNAGTKYFYVYANMNGVITAPGSGTTRGTFETGVLKNTVAAMTQNNNFYMGTLTGVKQDVTGNGTEDNPDHVSVSIGRLSAKLRLSNNSNGVNTSGGELAGSFDTNNAEYRILTEPASTAGYYQVLQTKGALGSRGTQVFSPYYYSYNSGNYNIQSTWGTETPIGTALYTYENTNQVPRWGSATSVEVRYKYTPAASEVYDAADPTQSGSLSGETFWVAIYDNGVRLIVDANGPAVHPQHGTPEEIVEYTNGYAYYVIPVTDIDESEVSAKYSVIRNHSYLLTVNSISRLGNNEPGDIDPPTEIERDVWIDVQIEVLDWFKVEQPVEL